MQRDRVLPRMIEDEMRESFLDYSMSVIVQRALPDVRDGLKPVHRRILYAMHEAGLAPNRPYKKSATVVGDVLGKYHPHGDSAVYDSLVRMVQDFSLRYPLVDGQGNFGSIDGDSAAAYRYTEARLAPPAAEMLADIDRETVDFAPNFDDRLQEPTVLPARLPNLLVNGSSGIAVGMSTNIPPHNLREVVKAAVHLLDDPDCTVAQLMRHLPGPDFPTGGLIVGRKGIRDAYEKGRGRVVMRARVQRERRRSGREQLVVTEIPYGTSKTRIIQQIADLTRKGRVSDISDLRDESDRDGIRLVIELKRDASVSRLLGQLFKWTSLQATFGVISLALDGGVPRTFDLKQLLERWRDHRVEVVVRRSRWELERARDRAHVLEGLLAALKRIDEVVAMIRSSRTRETAARKLRKELELTERQAQAILDMRLVRLTGLEAKALRDELKELNARISELEALLGDPARQIAVVRDELKALAAGYGDPRRTTIVESEKAITLERQEADEEVMVAVSHEGHVKQIPMRLFRRRMRSGKRLAGMERYEDDYLERLFAATTADVLLCVTDDGRTHQLPVRDVPESARSSRGRPLRQLLGLPKDAAVAAVFAVRDFPEGRLLALVTADGTVKRTPLSEFATARAGGIEAMGLRDGDRVVAAALTDGSTELVLAASDGRVIRFAEVDVPAQGRTAMGVRGMKLREDARVVAMIPVRGEAELCLVTERGAVLRIPLEELSTQNRGGLGGALLDPDDGEGAAVAGELRPGADLMAVTAVGRALRISAERPVLADVEGEEERLELSAHDRVVALTPTAEPAERPGASSDETEDEDGEEAAVAAGDDEDELDLFEE